MSLFAYETVFNLGFVFLEDEDHVLTILISGQSSAVPDKF